jgi:hypothetical protein
MRCLDVGSTGLRQSCRCSLTGCSPHGHSLELALLTAYGCPQQRFHVLGISNFLKSPLLPAASPSQLLTTQGLREGILTATCCLASRFSFESQWKPQWPHNSFILYNYKPSMEWAMPRSDTSTSCTWACLSYTDTKWVLGVVGQLPGSRWARTLLSKDSALESLWNKFAFLCLWTCHLLQVQPPTKTQGMDKKYGNYLLSCNTGS